MKITIANIHPECESLFKFTQMKIEKNLGPEFELNNDLCDFCFYVFSSIIRFDFMSFILIHNMTGFIFDDYADRSGSGIEEILEQLRHTNVTGEGFIEKWWRLCVNVGKEVMSANTLSQLLNLNIMCAGVELNDISTDDGRISSDDDFMSLRCIDSGAPHQFFLMLIGTGNQLTNELQNDPNYIGLNEQAGRHVSLVNDLYSLRKEVIDNTYKRNFVYVKMVNDSISAQEAANEIIVKVGECERLAKIYGYKLKEKNDANLSKYVDGILTAMLANHYWSTICKRYNQLNLT